jgi:hypothetical protein
LKLLIDNAVSPRLAQVPFTVIFDMRVRWQTTAQGADAKMEKPDTFSARQELIPTP